MFQTTDVAVRQVGKSTTIDMLFGNTCTKVTLDEIKKKIDEQRLQWLKEGEERKLMYILTGSNRFELQQGISDSLAGRCGVLDLLSFSRAEKEQTTGRAFHPSIAELLDREREQNVPYMTRREIFEEIFQGGMPDICTGISEREFYFKSYINTYIEKDVRKLIAASSEMQFRNFLELLALRTAQELRYDVLANSVGYHLSASSIFAKSV